MYNIENHLYVIYTHHTLTTHTHTHTHTHTQSFAASYKIYRILVIFYIRVKKIAVRRQVI